MRRSVVLLGLLGGCRIGFDPLGDDGTFGDTTVIPPGPGATDVVPAAIARTRDGGTVIAGSADHGAGFDWAVVRLDAAGRLDPAFGVGGVVVLDIGSTEDLATGIAVGPDDEIVVVGETHAGTGSDHDSVIVRLTPTGRLDPTLGGTGIRVWPVSTTHSRDDRARAVAVDASGRVIVTGYTNTGYPGWEDTYVARLAPDGTLDPTFGTAGITVTDGRRAAASGSANDFPRALAIDGQGRIVIGLTCAMDVCVARYDADGAPDPTFGTAGFVALELDGNDEAFDLALAPDDQILLAGAASPGGGTDRRAMVARLTTAGALDPTFGTAGLVALDLGPGDDLARTLAVEPGGAILVGGSTHTGAQTALAMARLSADGQPDASFGGTYVVHGGGTSARDLVIDATGRALLLARAGDRYAVIRHTPGQPWPTDQVPWSTLLPFDAPNTAAAEVALTDGQLLDGAATSAGAPLVTGGLTITGGVRTTGAPALFLDAGALAFAPGAVLSVDGAAGTPPTATTPGPGGGGASGGGGGGTAYFGYAGYGGRFGRAGDSFADITGGPGFAQTYARAFFYGLGGDGGRGRGCCPPAVPGGEAGNGGGGGGGGAWTNLDSGGGGGGGGLVVIVAESISGPGTITARGGGGSSINGTASGGGGGGVVWIATRAYDGGLTADVSGGEISVEERGLAGTARMFQILPDGTLVERAFTDVW